MLVLGVALVAPAAGRADALSDAQAALDAAVAACKAAPSKANGQAVEDALAALLALTGGPTGADNPEAPPAIVPEVEPNNTSGTAQLLSLAANYTRVAGAVTPAGDLDFFRIDSVPAGAKIWAYTDTGGALIAGSRDSFLEIRAADGTTIIESDDDDGAGNGCDGTQETGFSSSIAGRTLTAGGTYYVLVRGFGTFPGTAVVNPYVLKIALTTTSAAEVEPNGTIATANVLTTAGTPIASRTGSIATSGEVDYYSIEAAAGDVVFVSMDGDPARTGANTLDGVVSLRDGADTVLFSADSGFGGANNSEGFCFAIASSGTYYIRVAGFSTESGRNYQIMVAAGVAPTCTLTCPANISNVPNAPNQCSAPVNYPAPTTTGSCGTVVCSPPSGASFPAETTTFVTCTATAGPSCSFSIRVEDLQPPGVTPPNVVRPTDPNLCTAVVSYGAGAADNCGLASFACAPPSGSTFPLGSTVVTCSATDTAGNTTSATGAVQVNDNQPPALSCPANLGLFATPTEGGRVGTYVTPTPTDNCPGVGGASCAPPSGTFFPIGTTPISCGAQDASGNSASCGFNAVVTARSVTEIPTLDEIGLGILVLLLGAAALILLRRQ